MSSDESSAERVLGLLAELGWTLAVAESLTGGLLAAEIVAVAGASQVFRGGVVTYATDSKADILGVDPALLAERGAVDPQVATQMAIGARRLFGADVAMSTTGVAGPQGQDGKLPGQVYVAVSTPTLTQVRELCLHGDRTAVRRATVQAALTLGASVLVGDSPRTREQY